MLLAEEKQMMMRSIINIKYSSCTGCGLCVIDCSRDALTVSGGKAILVNDKLCLGDGNCLSSCPQQALQLINRRAEPFDIKEYLLFEEDEARNDCPAVLIPASGLHATVNCENTQTAGETGGMVVRLHSAAAENQDANMRSSAEELAGIMRTSTPERVLFAPAARPKEQNWPVKLSQINYVPSGADILLCADCAAAKTENFQEHYARNKYLITICPMLEETGMLASKLAKLFMQSKPRSLTTLRMNMECCNGAHMIGAGALNMSGAGITPRETIIGLDGCEVT